MSYSLWLISYLHARRICKYRRTCSNKNILKRPLIPILNKDKTMTDNTHK